MLGFAPDRHFLSNEEALKTSNAQTDGENEILLRKQAGVNLFLPFLQDELLMCSRRVGRAAAARGEGHAARCQFNRPSGPSYFPPPLRLLLSACQSEKASMCQPF